MCILCKKDLKCLEKQQIHFRNKKCVLLYKPIFNYLAVKTNFT